MESSRKKKTKKKAPHTPQRHKMIEEPEKEK